MEIRYKVGTKKWMALESQRITAELPLLEPMDESLALLHRVMESLPVVSRRALRRWFGIRPVVPSSLDGDPADVQSYGSMDEVEGSLSLKRGTLRQEIEALQGAWRTATAKAQEVAQVAVAARQQKEEEFTGELKLAATPTPDEAIRKAGFSLAIFALEGVAPEDVAAEKEWFATRLETWAQPLAQDKSAAIARQICLKELLIRRLSAGALKVNAAALGEDGNRRLKALREEESAYAELLKTLESVWPYMRGIQGKLTLHGTVADLVRLLQEYAAKKDETLVDGFFTATEIQVLMRRHNTAGVEYGPQYRPSLVAYVAMARQHLFDRDWRPDFTNSQWKRLDQAWATAEKAVRDHLPVEERDREPDLYRDGEEGEFPGLVTDGVPAATENPNAGSKA